MFHLFELSKTIKGTVKFFVFIVIFVLPILNWISYFSYNQFFISYYDEPETRTSWYLFFAFLHWGHLFVGTLWWIIHLGAWIVYGFRKDILGIKDDW